MTTLKSVSSLVLVGALFTAACGDSKSSMLPTAPSAVGASAQSEEAGSDGVSGPTAKGGIPGPPADKGNGNGNGNGNGKQPTNTSPTAPVTKKLEIEGLISAKGGDSITVNGLKVVVPSDCPIRHGQTPFTFAQLNVNDRVHVRAMRTTTAATPTLPAVTKLEATEVILQNPEDGVGSGSDTPSDLVSLTATDAFASEVPLDTATFTLTRSGSPTLLAAGLNVTYTVSGNATSAADYLPLSGIATFAPGAPTTTVVVTPVAGGGTESSETVTITLTNAAPYDLGSATATVTITDTNSAVVNVEAYDSTAKEQNGDEGTFRFTRNGGTLTSQLIVAFTVSGTASSGVDFTALPATITFPPNVTTVDVKVTPLKDNVNQEDSETVIVTVTGGPNYAVGGSSSATVTISQ